MIECRGTVLLLGRIPFYMRAPKREGVHLETQVVQNWGTEFDLSTLETATTTMLDEMPGP